jgi:hypothetical protein
LPALLGPLAGRPNVEAVPTGDAAHQRVINHHAGTITKIVDAIMPLSKPP